MHMHQRIRQQAFSQEFRGIKAQRSQLQWYGAGQVMVVMVVMLVIVVGCGGTVLRGVDVILSLIAR